MQHFVTDINYMRKCVAELANTERVSHDTETFNPRVNEGYSALYPFHGARAFAHIFSTEHDDFYFNFNVNHGGIDRNSIVEISPIFNNIIHISFYVNALYDNTILAVDGIINRRRIIDAPSIARVDYSRHGKDEFSDESFLSMDYLANYYKVQKKNDEVKKYIEEHNLYAETPCIFTGKKIPLYEKVPLELMTKYGWDDGRTTFDLNRKIIQSINYKDELYGPHRLDGKMVDIAKNEIKLMPYLIKAKVEGLKVWPEYIEKAIKHETKKENLLRLEVDAHTGGINLNSSKQVGKYLESQGVEVPRKELSRDALKRADAWELKAREYKSKKQSILEEIKVKPSKRLSNRLNTLEKRIEEAISKAAEYEVGNYQTDEKTLVKLAEAYDMPVLNSIIEAKKCSKKVGTYYNAYLKLKDENDIVHCNLRPETAKTGRFSCKEPNLQNLHKETWDKEDEDAFLVRKSFIANEPDELLLFADYSQQEMIVMLDQAEEMSVIEKLISGMFDDFYLATAAVIKEKTGKDISRKQAKAIALGLAYGQGIELLAKNLGCSISEAREIKKAFFAALPRLKELDNYLKKQVKLYGKIHNPYGRVTYIPKGKEYTALNAFVQGMSADITKTAIINTCELFEEHGLKSQFSLCIHDELVFRAKESELEKCIELIEKGMVSAYKHKHIKLGVDFELSHRNKYGVSSWGEKVNYS